MLEVLREPMLALLIAGGVIYLLLGDRGKHSSCLPWQACQ
jgi:hypothetical protein